MSCLLKAGRYIERVHFNTRLLHASQVRIAARRTHSSARVVNVSTESAASRIPTWVRGRIACTSALPQSAGPCAVATTGKRHFSMQPSQPIPSSGSKPRAPLWAYVSAAGCTAAGIYFVQTVGEKEMQRREQIAAKKAKQDQLMAVQNNKTASGLDALDLNKIDVLLEVSDRPMRYSTIEELQYACFAKAIELCRRGNKEDWDKISKIEQYLDKLKNMYGMSLFLELVKIGDAQSVKEYQVRFRNNASIYCVEPQTNNNALHLAVILGHAHLIDDLSNLLTIDNAKNAQGETALDLTFKHGQIKILEVMRPYVHLDDVTFPKYLSRAIASGRIGIFEMLLTFHVDGHQFLGKLFPRNNSVLHVAVASGHFSMLEHLLTKHYAHVLPHVNTLNEEGDAPMHAASRLGDGRMIGILAAQGAPMNAPNASKQTPVHVAVAARQPQALEALYEWGADFNPDLTVYNLPALSEKSTPQEHRCVALLQKYSVIKLKAKTAPPDFVHFPPENVVIEGGGPKVLASLGSIKWLENAKLLTKTKRFAGTSAGAILAALLATGHSIEEIEKLLKEKSLLDFLDYVDPAYANLTAVPKSKGIIDASKKLFATYWAGGKAIAHPVQQASEMFKLFSELPGLCHGEDFRLWMEARIQAKTGIANCTFGDLQNLIKQNPGKYKDLHVYVTQFFPGQVVRLSAEEFKNVVIADAVRCSMSIPGIFQPHILHFKDENGVRYPRPDKGKFMDGGIFKNLPLDAFDDNAYQGADAWGKSTNKRTLGIGLVDAHPAPAKAPSDPITPKDLAMAYYAVESILHASDRHVAHRVVRIPIDGVGLLDFDLNDADKAKLIAAGETATETFVNPKPDK